MAIVPTMSGGLPPLPTTTPQTGVVPPGYGALSPRAMSVPSPFFGADANEQVQGSLDYFMNPNNRLVQMARQEGARQAAERGGINSSIAAGASERAALEQAQGLAVGATQIQGQRDAAQLNDWMDSQSFSRSLAAMPYQSSMEMLKYLTTASINDPAVYTPSAVSGMSNFFNQNMDDILKTYFGGP